MFDNEVLASDVTEALIDSATSGLYVPTPIFNRMKSLLNAKEVGPGLYQVECQGLPDIIFKINGVIFVVDYAQYALAPVNNPYIDAGKCQLEVYESSFPAFHLGNSFMKNKLVVFDSENKRMGFAIPST